MPVSFDTERNAIILAPLAAVAAITAIALGNGIGLALAILAIVLFALACVSRADGFLLFGPFIRYELRRASRRSRIHLWRGLLAGVIGIGIIVGYGFTPDDLAKRDTVASIATIAFLFTAWHLFLIVFTIAVTLLTQAIATERDTKTLDFLLASDLRNREIVLGKAVGRLLAAISYPLAAVPLLLFLPILFGIDVSLVLYTFLYAAVTMTSICGLAILSSVSGSNKKRGGALLSMVLFPYMILTFGFNQLSSYPSIWFFPGRPQATAAYSVGDLVELIGIGNPATKFFSAIQIAAGGGGGSAGYALFLRDFPGYAAFHVGTGVICTLLAVRRLRTVSAALAGGESADAGELSPAPPVDDRPIAWKEHYFHPLAVATRRVRRKALYHFFSFLLIILPTVALLATIVSDLGGYNQSVRVGGRFWILGLGGITALAASRLGLESIVREREKDTLTSLILTDIQPRQIMHDKLTGILRIYRGTFIGIVALSAAAVAAGALPLWSVVPILMLLLTIIVTFATIGFHTSATAVSTEDAGKTYAWKLIPFASAGTLFFQLLDELNRAVGIEILYWLLGIAAVTLLYGLAGWLLWRSAVRRFEHACDPAAENGPQLESTVARP